MKLGGARGIAVVVALVAAAPGAVDAAPALRVQLTQKGDFALVGSSFGYDCAAAPAPVVGDVGACGGQTNDSAPDVFWRSDSPSDGQAEAGIAVDPSASRTTAVLELPPGATVSRALLYWAATGTSPDLAATLTGPDGVDVVVSASDSFTSSIDVYDAVASVADVTTTVSALGPGAYRVGDVDLPDWRNTDVEVAFGAWWLVVLYEDAAGDLRNLAVFDGLDGVVTGEPQEATLDGFVVPSAGYTGKLGVVALEGDVQAQGDQLSFDGDVLSDAENPADNFFNGSRTTLGVPVHLAGDLPELGGEAGSMSGLDLDVVDVTASLSANQTAATIAAGSSGDAYWLAAFVTSIATFAPDFVGTTKSSTDVDGAPLLPGDTLAFDVVARNGGNDAAVLVTLTDVLASGFVFVPGSLTVDGIPLTDAVGDDAFDYDPGTSTLTVRLGVGAGATQGGTLAEGAESAVHFEVLVDAGAQGTLGNQAFVSASGALGAGAATWPSGSSDGPGTVTDVIVDDCTDGGCGQGGAGGTGGGHAASSGSSGAGGSGGEGAGGAGTGGEGVGGAGGAGTGGDGGNASSSAVATASSSAAGGPGGAAPLATSVGSGDGSTSAGGSVDDDVTLRGNGLTCAAAPPAAGASGWLASCAIAAGLLALRRRRDARHASGPGGVARPGDSPAPARRERVVPRPRCARLAQNVQYASTGRPICAVEVPRD